MTKLEIIDNFLNEDHHQKLSSIKLDDINPENIKVYHNEISGKNQIIESCIDRNLLVSLHNTYHDKVFNILKDLNYEKSKLYDYSDFTIIKTGKNYKFPIHDDTPNKLLSGVCYLYPTNNTGTIFYSNKRGDGKKIIDWERNRAVFFSRHERQTWHSYEGDGVSDRVVLVYNLMTKRIKEVYEIEKKNYILGNLRQKINPHLYKYFKLYI